jgi:hypothetical protein
MTEEIKKENVGTELLEKVIKEGVEVYKVASEKLADGFQWQKDSLPIVWEVKDLSFIFTKWKEIAEEGKDLSFDEFETLIQKLIGELGGTSEEIEELIICATDWIKSTYDMYMSVKKIVDKNKLG